MGLIHVDKYLSVPSEMFNDNFERFFYVGYYAGTSFRVCGIRQSYDDAVKLMQSLPYEYLSDERRCAKYVIVSLSINVALCYDKDFI